MNAPGVFINCPFTADYQDFFNAIVFTVTRSGFTARCARESDDAGEVRFEKICSIIKACRFGIHDISKTEPDAATGLPRFNMPFELGLFLGARKFGSGEMRRKKALIMDLEPYRYQAFLSDIAGQDIHPHAGDVRTLIEVVATWLRDEVHERDVPGGRAIADEYERFRIDIPRICEARKLHPEELTFTDYRLMAAEWIVVDSGGA